MHKTFKKNRQDQTAPIYTGQNKSSLVNISPLRSQGRSNNQASHPRNSSNTNNNKKLKIKHHQLQTKNSAEISQFQFQNQRMRQKIKSPQIHCPQKKEHFMKIQRKNKNQQQQEYNPYSEIYHNDLKYYQQYLQSTQKNAAGGINLKWPYYFGIQ